MVSKQFQRTLPFDHPRQRSSFDRQVACPLSLPNLDPLWEEPEDAVGQRPAAGYKKLTIIVRKKIERDLVSVYCSASDAATVAETPAIPRNFGVHGERQYKSDKATFDGREQYLDSSADFEGPEFKLLQIFGRRSISSTGFSRSGLHLRPASVLSFVIRGIGEGLFAYLNSGCRI